MADKISGRVKDPVTAEKLIPKDHCFGMSRPPMEWGYPAFRQGRTVLT